MRGESPEGLPREDRAIAAQGLRRGLGVLALRGRGPAGRECWVPGPAGAAEGRQAGAARPRASSRPPPGAQLGVSSCEGPRLPLPDSSNFWKPPPSAPDVWLLGYPAPSELGAGKHPRPGCWVSGVCPGRQGLGPARGGRGDGGSVGPEPGWPGFGLPLTRLCPRRQQSQNLLAGGVGRPPAPHRPAALGQVAGCSEGVTTACALCVLASVARTARPCAAGHELAAWLPTGSFLPEPRGFRQPYVWAGTTLL